VSSPFGTAARTGDRSLCALEEPPSPASSRAEYKAAVGFQSFSATIQAFASLNDKAPLGAFRYLLGEKYGNPKVAAASQSRFGARKFRNVPDFLLPQSFQRAVSLCLATR
jgi:hypothetical protein